MPHLTAPTKRALRTWVLQAEGHDEAAAARALTDTLSLLLPQLSADEVVDVFAEPMDWPGHLRREQVRWRPPCTDLLQALAAARPDGLTDVAWVRAGWRLTPGWRERLQQALLHDESLAIMGPLSLDHPWRSPLGDRQERRRETLRGEPGHFERLGSWLAAHAPAAPTELGSIPQEAGVIRGPAAAALAARCSAPRHDGPWSWSALLTQGRWVAAFSRQVLTCQIEPADADTHDLQSSLLADREVWRHAHPLHALRAALAEAWPEMQRQAVVDSRPVGREEARDGREASAPAGPASKARHAVRLHVAHSWGGGLSKWVQDFVRTDREGETGTGLVLRSVGVFGAFGQRLCLYAGDEEVVPLRFWELGVPVHATAAGHLEVSNILREIIESFGVDQVVVSSLIGHSLDVLRTGLPTVVVAHDHYPFCVTLYAEFDGECRSCSRERLGDCLQRNPAHRFFNGVNADDWMGLREAFVQAVSDDHIPIVAPSPSVASRWLAMMPSLRPSQVRVIEHGLDLPPAPPFEPPTEGPLRVLFLGRLSPEKGVDLLLDMLEPLLAFAELTLLGCGERVDPAFSRPGVNAIANFDNRELPRILSTLQPHVGLLISTVPETYSYALSELWHAGIPVMGTACGALADRIEDGVTGYVVEPKAELLLQRLRHVHQHRDEILRMREHLLKQPPRTLQHMLADYLAVLPVPNAQKEPAAVPDEWRTVDSARSGGGAVASHRPLHKTLLVNPEVTWLQAARGFWQFTCLKAARSPRLSPWVRRLFARLARQG